MRKLFVIPVLTLLAGCASVPDANQSLFAVASAYTAAEIAVNGYETNPAAKPDVVATMKKLDNQAYAALSPLLAAGQAGASAADAAQLEAAQAAVSALAAYVAQNGVK